MLQTYFRLLYIFFTLYFYGFSHLYISHLFINNIHFIPRFPSNSRDAFYSITQKKGYKHPWICFLPFKNVKQLQFIILLVVLLFCFYVCLAKSCYLQLPVRLPYTQIYLPQIKFLSSPFQTGCYTTLHRSRPASSIHHDYRFRLRHHPSLQESCLHCESWKACAQ